MHDRFDQDFHQACEELEILKDESQLHNTQVGCAQMSQIFLKLGFVSPIAQESEQFQLAEIWKLIGGDMEGQGKIPLSNVKNFLRAIQNFHHQDIIDTERQGLSVNAKQLGRQTSTGLVYKPSEIEYITRNYRLLYSNRQDRLAEYKKQQHLMRAIQKQDFGEQFAYKPQTSLKTAKLADKKRQSYQT
jgi:hypothetical protein